jgi:hypothetical protein
MSYDDSFRPRAYIHEHDTFDVIGKPMRIQEIKPNQFDGPIAEWADYRAANFNDKIVPVITLPEGEGDDLHRVSWVYHEWRDNEADSTHAMHHIACDCSIMAEISGEPESILECDTLQKTLNLRAGLIR